ncbi:hypothetical protein SteCoe_335 [Stentor coeruleus]|uniref:Uncharacterized protein n=1 Tax=Stentor coeruleus TaxID=5963 RepID=A0A1R2D4G4_9CILI|nr:hypothetical protein SteCoe_335 [Stentor coeruleus]
MESSPDYSSPINFIIGPCQSEICDLYYPSNKLSFSQHPSEQVMSKAIYYKNDCILPCIDSSYENANQLEALIIYLQEIPKANNLRLILVFDEAFIKTSRSSQFYNYCNEIIQILGLTPDCACGIHIIATNSSPKFINGLPQILKCCFPNEHNFLIEGIKNRTIKISSFDKNMYQDNINSIFNMMGTTPLCGQNFKLSLKSKISELSEKSIYNCKSSDMIFLSDLPSNLNSYVEARTFESDKILIIDRDIDYRGEKLIINSPTVIIKVKEHESRLITLRGHQPTIIFSEKVNFVINGEKLILTISNEYDDEDFISPLSENFDERNDNIRLESICINDWWTENISLNNKFIDLIVYFKRNENRIQVDDKWNIKKVDCDIYMKLHINERSLRTKNNIVENFKSLRRYENLDQYLDSIKKKTELSYEYKIFLENYIARLPSIFQIFMSQSLFRKISSENSEINDLRNIRKLFIKRYLGLLDDFDSNPEKCNISKIEKNNRESYEISKSFIERVNRFTGNLMHKNSELINELDIFFMRSLDDQYVNDFLRFYNTLATKNDKVALFKYKIAGDLLNTGIAQITGSNENVIANEGINAFAWVAIISINCLSALLLTEVIKRYSGFSNPNKSSSFILSHITLCAFLVIASVFTGINFTWAYRKSGYYKNTIKVEGKNIRFNLK